MDGAEDPGFAGLLVDSYRRLTGTSLLDERLSPEQAARWLYREAPFGLLAHQPGDDPLFRYANLVAQRAFGYTWTEFDGLPSRLSAAAPDRDERARLLDGVTRHGFSNDYRGLRIGKSGARFWIEDATVWNLLDTSGAVHGQAAVFRSTTPA